MPVAVLTTKSVAAASAPDGGRHEMWDALVTGLGLRVGPGGKTWVFRYRMEGARRRLTLGHYPALSLADARAQAKAHLETLDRGLDPEAASNTPAESTIRALVHRYIEERAKPRMRSWRAEERLFAHHVLPELGAMPVSALTAPKVAETVAKVAGRVQPNRVRAALSRFCAWAGTDYSAGPPLITGNPALAVPVPKEEKTRDRVLTDAELAAIWHACDALDSRAAGAAIRLLCLTGQRRTEAGGLCWDELAEVVRHDYAGVVWTLPEARTKNGRPHTIPLRRLADATICAVPDKGSPFAFPARGNPQAAVTGWSKIKPKLDTASGVSDWTLHDIRRTVASGMARLGVAPHVIERLLNHVSGGAFSGVAGIYNRYSYLAEMATALDRWEEHVAAVIAAHKAS